MPNKFYPKLSRIVSLSSFPAELDFIQGGLQQVLDNLRYRNYQVSYSSDKITTTTNMDLVTEEEIKLPVLETGFYVICTGFATKFGGSFPSKNHVNGSALDSGYLSTSQKSREFIEEMFKFGFDWFKITSKKSSIKGKANERTYIGLDYGTGHDTHIHSQISKYSNS